MLHPSSMNKSTESGTTTGSRMTELTVLIDSTVHIRQITLTGKHNNNKMERINGEIRDREKVMRSLKKTDTPILTGYRIYHNYIRGHEALDGRTPADECGIKVEGKDKWLTLIQNATRTRKAETQTSSGT
jgi:hypothetical protein